MSLAGRFAGFPIRDESVTFGKGPAVGGCGKSTVSGEALDDGTVLRHLASRAAARQSRNSAPGRRGAPRHGRSDRRGVYSGPGREGFRGPGVCDSNGFDGSDPAGRHKDVACPQCGFKYAVNASQEAESRSANQTVYSGLCVNCRYHAMQLNDSPSFKGDRILVMMLPYDLPFLPGSGPPERWDVVVFRYPEEPEVSYIKRLVGLPGETIRIYHGDVFVKSAGSDKFQQARKPITHQSATQIVVNDDRHRPQALLGKGEWQRWQSTVPGWKVVDAAASRYQADGGTPDEWVELRYRNLVPDPEQWEAILGDRALPRQPRSTLVTDFYSYNTNMSAEFYNLVDDVQQAPDGAWMQPHWVGDLTLKMHLEVAKVAPGALVRLELIKAGVAHRCTIDVETGIAVVTRGQRELGQWQTPIKGPGQYHLEFANVDHRVSLVVDGRPVGGNGIEFETNEACADPDIGRPGSRGDRRSKCFGDRQRPCPFARYLLYPDARPGRLRDRLGRPVPSQPQRAFRFSLRSIRGLPTSPT